MNGSERLDEIAASLFAAQRDLKNPEKKTPGAVRGGKALMYADLPTILDHLRPALEKVSLAVMQDVRGDELYALVTHSSGQWLEFGPYPLFGKDDQTRGGSVTYARRYQLCGIFRIAADDEDPDASAPSSPSQRSDPESTAVTSGRDGSAERGAEEPVGVGEGPAGSAPHDKSDLSFHPNTPHRMRPADDFPGYLACTKRPCPYWEYVDKTEVTA